MSHPPDYPPFLLDVLQAHGAHSLAYSIRQPGMSYFGDAVRGLIAYQCHLGQCTVLGDPICAVSEKEALLHDFVNAHPKALFIQINVDTLRVLRDLGFRSSPVGVENEIIIADFSLCGKRKADLRHYRNKATKAGLMVAEAPDTAQLRATLKPISDTWLPSKSWFAHELEFLARPYQSQPEPGVRIFIAYQNDVPLAFVILDPMWRNGEILGYCVSILRHYPNAPEGAVDYVILQVIEKLREEGVPMLSLGVSPFHRLRELAQSEGVDIWPIYWLYHALNHFGSPIYHFRGLSFHKSRYRASESPVFTATRSPIGLLPLYASARACKML